MEPFQIMLGFFLSVLTVMFFFSVCLRLVELFDRSPRRPVLKRSYAVSKDAAREMFDQLKQAGVLGDDLPEEREEYVVTELYCFARRAVFAYTDQTPEPDRKETP